MKLRDLLNLTRYVPMEEAVEARRKAATTVVSTRRSRHPSAGETIIVTFADKHEVEVCSFCLGNCGQCGTSLGMGLPPLMDAMVLNLESGRG